MFECYVIKSEYGYLTYDGYIKTKETCIQGFINRVRLFVNESSAKYFIKHNPEIFELIENIETVKLSLSIEGEESSFI